MTNTTAMDKFCGSALYSTPRKTVVPTDDQSLSLCRKTCLYPLAPHIPNVRI